MYDEAKKLNDIIDVFASVSMAVWRNGIASDYDQ
jgi:hypothetical protein